MRVELIKILNIRVASSRSVDRSATPTLIGRSGRRYISNSYCQFISLKHFHFLFHSKTKFWF